jgi:hypothetical protein
MPNERFLRQPKPFWANIRTISQQIGYTKRGAGQIKIPTPSEMRLGLEKNGLKAAHLVDEMDRLTDTGELVHAYLVHRATALNNYVEPLLMDVDRARLVFADLLATLKPTRPVPMNKQTGDKARPAYFTGIINMLISAHAQGYPCDFDPRGLTSVTLNDAPLRTLARRVDGCFPRLVNPIAVWEIKEYYYTTTFGSWVADGVYETLLDGMEIEELRDHERVDIRHYLMVDSHFTWWECGRSYLCRIFDMLHMGYVDEVLFGYEVVERMPAIVGEWIDIARSREVVL